MRLEFVKAFTEITQSVFIEALSDNEVFTGQPCLTNTPHLQNTVVATIELTGDLSGKIFLQMERSTAIAIGERMLGSTKSSGTLITSCIGELTSMVVGRTISWINDQTYQINMSPPVITLDSTTLAPMHELETLIIDIKTPQGKTVLNVCFLDAGYNATNKVTGNVH